MEFLFWLILLVLLIVYIRKTTTLSTKLSKLESEIRQLRDSIASSPPTKTTSPVTPIPATESPEISFPQPKPSISVAPPRSSRTRSEWEALIGGKLLNRVGALALILGVAFFLKYAFDKNWISETVRVLIGFLTGAGLLFAGAHWYKKDFKIFAQGLIGAGIAILYLSAYASFNYYHLVSQPVAFVFMSLVTALTFWQGVRYDSLAIALLGWAGGFLTPILLSTGQANEAGLFTYITLLDIGLLAILLKKETWGILEPFTLAATYLMYFLWYDEYYKPENLLLTVLFLSIFWGLFYALEVIRIISATKTFAKIRQAVASANAFFYYIAMYAIIDSSHHRWMSTVTLIIGAIYFLTFLMLKRGRLGEETTYVRLNLTAIALLIIATAVQFSNFPLVIFWSLEALILVWCGIHWEIRYIWQAALGLMGLALLKLLGTDGALSYSAIEKFKLILNQRVLTFTTLAATLGASAILFKRMEEKERGVTRTVLHGGLCILVFILLTAESNDYFRRAIFFLEQNAGGAEVASEMTRLENLQQLTLSGVWLLYSVLLMVTGIWRRIQGMRIMSIILFGFTILKIFIYDLSFLETLYRIFSFIGLGLILLAVSYLYQRYKTVILN